MDQVIIWHGRLESVGLLATQVYCRGEAVIGNSLCSVRSCMVNKIIINCTNNPAKEFDLLSALLHTN